MATGLVHVLLQLGNGRSLVASLQDCLCFVEWSFEGVWCSVVVPSTVVNLLFEWRNWFEKHPSDVWNITLLVWRQSNSRTFEDRERSLDQLKSTLIHTLFDWSRTWDCDSYLEFQLLFCFLAWFVVIFYDVFIIMNKNESSLSIKF